jgi:hypothetical protein
MGKIIQNEDDFKRYLSEQIGFLKKSAKEYDNGDIAEYKNMSSRLRVLLYDHGRNVSLLSHLKIKDILFYNSSTGCDKKLIK